MKILAFCACIGWTVRAVFASEVMDELVAPQYCSLETDCHDRTSSFVLKENASLLDYLNPDILNDHELMERISKSLKKHELVVLRDAFVPEFADYVWQDLYRDDLDWPEWSDYGDDGFSFNHHNFYYTDTFTKVMNETDAVFQHPDSKSWIANLTDRETSGKTGGSPSRYFPGDFSMPHTDYSDVRTVAYVWHLSRDWDPAWGGALYWSGEPELENAYVHASYNTLNLFSVNLYTSHFVSRVSPHAPDPEYKRLTWNGWWEDHREFNLTQAAIHFDTPEKRLHITESQAKDLLAIDAEDEESDDMERQEQILQWQETFREEWNRGSRQNSMIVDLYDRRGEERRKRREARYDEDEEDGYYYEDEEDEEDDDEEYNDEDSTEDKAHDEL